MKQQLVFRIQQTPASAARTGPVLQRKCACGKRAHGAGECDGCRKRREATLQRVATTSGPVPAVPPLVHEVLRAPGSPLDGGARAFFEPRFGHDFSRVHTDARAAESAEAVEALAYTVGQHIVFGAGQYQPDTREGRRLLAHELAHTVQQRGSPGPLPAALAVARPGDPAESEAEAAAEAVLEGRRFTPTTLRPPHLARQRGSDSGGGSPAGPPLPGASAAPTSPSR
jgi:hypothetical protein